MTPREALESGALELGIDLGEAGIEKLLQYLQLLAKWNKTYNLTAIRDPLEMVKQHLLDSLAVVPHLPVGRGAEMADVGSGGGLPGIPLAIARPGWQITVNDANQKKAAFLRQAAIELALPNVAVHEGRVESWTPARRFELVITRAFAEIAQFIASCRHLVRPGGWLAAMKGLFPTAELARVPTGCDCGRVVALRVPLLAAERHLVLCTVSA